MDAEVNAYQNRVARRTHTHARALLERGGN